MQTPPATLAKAIEIQHAQHIVMFAMATLAEQRESDTESHILRVQNYVRVLATQLSGHPAFESFLGASELEILCDSVPLYDMGSMGVPDRILLKPGRLSADEINIMRTHTTIGHEALVRAEATLGHASPLLTIAKEVVLCHQEKWDGSGYPQRLAGKRIPASARIIALADVYDALISNKVYKDGVSHDKAVEIILKESGSHFDPDVVDAFMVVQAEFQRIAQRHADTDADMQRKIEYMANAIAEVAEL